MAYLIVVFLLLMSIVYFLSKRKKTRQTIFLLSYEFPSSVKAKVKEKYPHLTDDQIQQVFDALRDYFYICNKAKKRMVAMPSQVVDMAWHEFILCTKAYEVYCNKAIGRFLHHTPTEAMKTPTLAQEGIKRAWRLSCAKEAINPSSPRHLPLLFAIDGLLNIEDGFQYALNCKDKSSASSMDGFCAGHIGCASGCGGDSGNTEDTSDSAGFFDSSDDSGGSDCGGGGCGGD